MKKSLLFIIFVNIFLIKISFAEIVTLDDGRTVELNEDGTFTVISENSNSNFEQSVVSLLDLLSIDYGSIDFLNSKIILNEISIEDLYIEELIVDNLNTDYIENLNLTSLDTYKGQIFENLSIKNLRGENGDVQIELFQLKKLDFKDISFIKNIAMGKEFDPINFLVALDSLSIQKLEIKNLIITDGSFYTFLDSVIMSNLENSSIDQITYNNLEVQSDISVIKVDQFQLKKLKFNSPSKYKDQFNEFSHPREVFLFFDSLQSAESKGYYAEFSNGVAMSMEKSVIKNFKTKEINGINIPVSYQAVNENMKFIINDPLIQGELLKLGYKNLVFNQRLNLLWNDIANMFNFNFWIGMEDGAEIELKAKLEDIDFYEIIDLSLSPAFEDYMQNNPKIKKLELSLKDKGLTEKLIQYGSNQFGMPKDEFVQYMLNILDSSATYTAGIDQNLTNQFIISLQNFIEQPNKITFSINPKFALSAYDIMSLQPESLEETLNMRFK